MPVHCYCEWQSACHLTVWTKGNVWYMVLYCSVSWQDWWRDMIMQSVCGKNMMECQRLSLLVVAKQKVIEKINWSRGKWDGKESIFRPTFDVLMSPKCTKLYRFAPIRPQNFPAVTLPDPQNWGWVKPPGLLPANERPPSHFFRASAATANNLLWTWS